MEALLIILLFYFLLYVVQMSRLAYGLGRVPEFELRDEAPATTFTIVVPFRNESRNLPALLESIAQLDYPRKRFEIILVDDGSQDDGQSLVYRWRMQHGSLQATLLENIRRSGSPKKDAISRAIPIATGDWIVTTDADCTVPVNWLRALNQFIRSTQSRMVAGPVSFNKVSGLLGNFQGHDLLAMQGATIGGFGIEMPFMCNGANFAYEKKLFQELGGFTGNDNKPGGDDVFLLHKAVEADAKVGYLKSREALVQTRTEKSWKRLVNQRIRWGSKTGAYQNDFAEDVALAVFLGNAAIILLAVLALSQQIHWMFFVGPFGVKFLIDLGIMIGANKLVRQRKWVLPVFSAMVHPIFTVLVALLSVRGKYSWKGRKWRSN